MNVRYSVEAKLSPYADEIAACFELAVTDLIILRPEDRGDGGGLALVYYAPHDGAGAVGSVAAELAHRLPLVVSYTASAGQPGIVVAGKLLAWSDLRAGDPSA